MNNWINWNNLQDENHRFVISLIKIIFPGPASSASAGRARTDWERSSELDSDNSRRSFGQAAAAAASSADPRPLIGAVGRSWRYTAQ